MLSVFHDPCCLSNVLRVFASFDLMRYFRHKCKFKRSVYLRLRIRALTTKIYRHSRNDWHTTVPHVIFKHVADQQRYAVDRIHSTDRVSRILHIMCYSYFLFKQVFILNNFIRSIFTAVQTSRDPRPLGGGQLFRTRATEAP